MIRVDRGEEQNLEEQFKTGKCSEKDSSSVTRVHVVT